MITFAEEAFVHDTSGRSHYTKICNQLGLVPINYFMRHIQDTELAMRYHGLGPSAARAIALVLKVGFFIQMYSLCSIVLSSSQQSHIKCKVHLIKKAGGSTNYPSSLFKF